MAYTIEYVLSAHVSGILERRGEVGQCMLLPTNISGEQIEIYSLNLNLLFLPNNQDDDRIGPTNN